MSTTKIGEGLQQIEPASFDENSDTIADLIASLAMPTTRQMEVGEMALDDFYNGTKDSDGQGAFAQVYRAMKALDSDYVELQRLRDAIRYILPMAKGYAHKNPVGINAELIADAEALLSPPKQQAPVCKCCGVSGHSTLECIFWKVEVWEREQEALDGGRQP
jgi:hypothetical protein